MRGAVPILPNALPGVTLHPGESLYRLTRRTEDELGDIWGAVYRAGDELQRSAVNLLFDLALPSAYRHLPALGIAAADQASELARLMESGRARELAAVQIRNTIEVFNLVKNVRTLIGDIREGSLQSHVERAYGLGKFPALWAVEGLGHDYTSMKWDPGTDSAGIMTEGEAAALPPQSLTMMHAGLGLRFAEVLCRQLTPYSTAREADRIIGRYVALCRANSRPGYTGCAIESLGLVTRTWNPHIVRLVDAALERVAPDAMPFFWHGAGRAMYFSPSHLVEQLYSPWISAELEPPREVARVNARAGVTWAFTLVNMRQPAVIESLLRRRESQLGDDDGFRFGVTSCVTMATDIVEDHPVVHALLQYRPSCCSTSQLWERQVRRPAAEGCGYQRVLRAAARLDEVFRYCDLKALAGGLDGVEAAA